MSNKLSDIAKTALLDPVKGNKILIAFKDALVKAVDDFPSRVEENTLHMLPVKHTEKELTSKIEKHLSSNLPKEFQPDKSQDKGLQR